MNTIKLLTLLLQRESAKKLKKATTKHTKAILNLDKAKKRAEKAMSDVDGAVAIDNLAKLQKA